MFKKVFSGAAIMLLPAAVLAQFSITGKVTDADNQQALSGATITLNGRSTTSDEQGVFRFNRVREGDDQLKVSFIGYETFKEQIRRSPEQEIQVQLHKSEMLSDEVIISSSRVSEKSAATFTSIDRKEIRRNNLGQDLPYLLNQTPSAVVTSDAGTGIGYTGIRIRGSDATRTNVTINGIPLNDAESQGTFLVNLPDFASSVDNIQVQRGVGTSTNGAGAFGASINMETDKVSAEPFAEVNSTHGSYQTDRYSAKVGTGILNKHWSFTGRLSKIASQGYIENSSSKLKSFFTTASYFDEKNLLKMVVFSGTERTYLAWSGVAEDQLKTNRKYNSLAHPFASQTDNYQQDHYQIFYSRQINKKLNANVAYHFTRGQGYYEEYKKKQKFSQYGMDTLFTPNDTIARTDLVRRRWLSNEFQGLVYSLDYVASSKLHIVAGGALNEYDGEHFGEVVWARYSSNKNMYDRFYTTYGTKREANFYAKADYRITRKLGVFGDVQFRGIDYRISGVDKEGTDLTQQHALQFFNPKAGVTYEINPASLLYVSYSVANKEPNRDDYTTGVLAGRTPKPEHLRDLEAGYKNRNKRFGYELNYFLMNYRDQLILTGEVNDVGDYVRQNIPESYRTGIEISTSWNITKRFNWLANLALSENKIRNFTEYIYEYDADYNYLGTTVNQYSKTDISFSPSVIAGSQLRYQLFRPFSVCLQTKYVGKQYMDNTADDKRSLDAFLVNDLLLDLRFPFRSAKEISLVLKVNNIFNELYEANGYTYSEIIEGVMSTNNFYFPQAERNILFGANLKF
jgi:iron complex outermembrane receptor protein